MDAATVLPEPASLASLSPRDEAESHVAGVEAAAGSLDQESAPPYEDSAQHLLEELVRIDLLVRAQTARWHATIGASKPPDLWGMLHISDDEVRRYLEAPFRPLPSSDHDGTGAEPFVRAATMVDRRIRARLQQRPGADLRLQQLRRRFELSDLESDVLLVCMLPALEGRYRRLYGYLMDDASREQPNVELVLEILAPLIGPLPLGRNLFEPTCRLLADRLVEVRGDGSLLARSVLIDERIAAFLLESDAVDPRLASFVAEMPPHHLSALDTDTEPGSRLAGLAHWWFDLDADAGAAISLHGRPGSGRLAVARALCTATHQRLFRVDISRALTSGQPWEEVVDRCYREALLGDSALYWAGCESLLDRDGPPGRWRYLLEVAERAPTLTFFASDTGWEPQGAFSQTALFRLEFPQPTFDLRKALWASELSSAPLADGLDRTTLADELAASFRLNAGRIADAAAAAHSLALVRDPASPRITSADLFDGCRRQSGRQLSTFGRRIEPRPGISFADLVLPGPNQRQLHELRTRIRSISRVAAAGFEARMTLGKGLIALFTGSSGTGKTMAAELLAREQGVDLFKVDLSSVVSKWVGETEKNLANVFADAESANAIIFFDEADALFGKRGEVRQSQDRWANMEINYLLQRVEEYAGVVILASNLRQNIDEAFLRRIHVIVEFPAPDSRARLSILQGLFPPGIGRPDDADLTVVAERFKVSGGSLKNIVLDAAFRAFDEARDGPPSIELRHLMLATAREYQKLGRPMTRSEFGDDWYPYLEHHIL